MAEGYESPRHPRGHDSSDCRVTYASLDGCPDDCDCCCHSDDSQIWIADELGIARRGG